MFFKQTVKPRKILTQISVSRLRETFYQTASGKTMQD